LPEANAKISRAKLMSFSAANSHKISTGFLMGVLLLLLAASTRAYCQTEVVIDFQKAEITGRWVDSWEEKGVVFTPAHAPKLSKAKARLMFFPHPPSGRKGILNAMATDPIPVRARFPNGSSSVTVEFWGSTGCPARLEAYDAEGKLLDKAALEAAPARKAPEDPIPTFQLTVKGSNIAYIEFSGPRAGEYLVANEVRFVPLAPVVNHSSLSLKKYGPRMPNFDCKFFGSFYSQRNPNPTQVVYPFILKLAIERSKRRDLFALG
jgi:hypothetical protein